MKQDQEKKQKTRYVYDRKEPRKVITIIVFVIWFWVFVIGKLAGQ